MLLKLNLTVKCKLCSNMDDKEFYIMPEKEKVPDGFIFSATKFKIVCKLCGNPHNLNIITE